MGAQETSKLTEEKKHMERILCEFYLLNRLLGITCIHAPTHTHTGGRERKKKRERKHVCVRYWQCA